MTIRLTFRANGDANSFALLDADTGNWFISLLVNGEQMEAKQLENLRRLVATWNACDGIPTDLLQRSRIDQLTEVSSPGEPDPGNHGRPAAFKINPITIGSLIAERDALLKALTAIAQSAPDSTVLGLQQTAASAITEPAQPPAPRITTNSASGKPDHTCNWVDTQPYGSKCTICGDTIPF